MGKRGRDVLLEVLESEGVSHVFGNPGTTELPLIDALTGSTTLHYVLGLQESTVVGMADGYTLASGRPSFVNLHAAAGLGNGVGNLVNAQANGSPIVVTAGQQDRRHLAHDPLLAGDLVGLAAPVVKWGHEVPRAADLGILLRRAFHDVAAAPTGPVFLSLPSDVLDELTTTAVPPPSTIRRTAVAEHVDELADRLASIPAGRLAIVAGDENAHAGGVDALVEVAELFAAPVWGAPLYGVTVFPTSHPLWRGALPSSSNGINEVLSQYDAVFLVGGQAFKVYPWSERPCVPDDVVLIHLAPDPTQVGRTWSTGLGVVADPSATLRALTARLAASTAVKDASDSLRRAAEDAAARREERERGIVARYEATPMAADVAVHAVLAAAPADAVVVNEAITTGLAVRDQQLTSMPGRYFFARGGGLGWGMPAAVGVSLGLGRERVFCFVGDGSAMYSPQALWTAARERLPVVFVVVNNAQYLILKQALRARQGLAADMETFVGMDLEDPAVDFMALAASMGVPATRVERAGDVGDIVKLATSSGGPHLIELPIAAP